MTNVYLYKHDSKPSHREHSGCRYEYYPTVPRVGSPT